MDDQGKHPETKPSGSLQPPRPPIRTAIGLGPEDDDSDKRGKFTITKSAEGEGKFIRESGGRPHHGHLIIRVEPGPKGSGVSIASEVSETIIPAKFVQFGIKGIQEFLDFSVLGGRTVTDFSIAIIDGSYDKDALTEVSFRLAGILAIKDAVKKAGPILIE